MKYCFLFCIILSSISCWKYRGDYNPNSNPNPGNVQLNLKKVWGSIPVYTSEIGAKQIEYTAKKYPVIHPGNIYAKANFIFQVDVGLGIHVIDNTIPAQADRIGFIKINGCSQMSIRGNYLYTNSLDDLVTIDLTDTSKLREVNRVKNAFPELRYSYPLVQPEEKGYYVCPRTDSIVIGWTKDSIFQACYKN